MQAVMSGRNDTPGVNASPDLREKAARLFAYLRELAKLRLSTVRDCRDYEEALFFHEIPNEPECASIARSNLPDDGEPWLRIARADEPNCPEPPPICSAWVDSKTLPDSSAMPRLRDEIATPNTDADASPVVRSLRDHPDVQRMWDSYLHEKWELWAPKHRRWQTIQRVYDRLFSMHRHRRSFFMPVYFRVPLHGSRENVHRIGVHRKFASPTTRWTALSARLRLLLPRRLRALRSELPPWRTHFRDVGVR